jgi:single-strand DNA-binding protein
VAGEYLSKGSPVLIEGRLKLETWETEGQKRSKLKVVGERMQMVGGRSGGSVADESEPRRASRSGEQNEYNQPAAVSASESTPGDQTSEDIPF